jgi:hypothetical protein
VGRQDPVLVPASFPTRRLSPLASLAEQASAKYLAPLLPNLESITPSKLMPTKPSIREFLPTTGTRQHSTAQPRGSSSLARLLDLLQPR